MTGANLLTLDDAAKRLDPSGRLSARSLRTEAYRGRLVLVKIAGKHFVTEDALQEMIKECRFKESPRAYGSVRVTGKNRIGLSKTEENSTSLAVASKTALALRERSLSTSNKNGVSQN